MTVGPPLARGALLLVGGAVLVLLAVTGQVDRLVVAVVATVALLLGLADVAARPPLRVSADAWTTRDVLGRRRSFDPSRTRVDVRPSGRSGSGRVLELDDGERLQVLGRWRLGQDPSSVRAILVADPGARAASEGRRRPFRRHGEQAQERGRSTPGGEH